MIFTPDEVRALFDIVDLRLAEIIVDVLGKEYLSDEDKTLLKKFNFDLKTAIDEVPPYQQAYLFGRLSSVLNPNQLQSLEYKDLKSYIEKNQYKQPSQRDLAEYKAASLRTYSYLKGMGTRVKETLSNSISQEELKRTIEERRREDLSIVKEEIKRGIVEKRTIQNIVSDIGHQTEDWNRDWGRIVETEMQNIYCIGKSQTIIDDHGIDSLVYKEVFVGACKHCIKAYTTQGVGTKPRIFKMSSLLLNGDNIGRKVKDWKPVLGTMHPFCANSPYIEITTFDGPKYIKDIKVGDVVLTHLNRYKKVVRTFKRMLTEDFKEGVYDVYYLIEDESNEGIWKEEGIHRFTGNHNFFVNGKEKQLKDIVVGDLLQYRKGVKVKVSSILEIPKENYGDFLYNFEVQDDHSYYAENIAVSNCRCDLRYIPEGYVWDEESQSFVPPKNYERKVERKSKVKITVGDKVFEV